MQINGVLLVMKKSSGAVYAYLRAGDGLRKAAHGGFWQAAAVWSANGNVGGSFGFGIGGKAHDIENIRHPRIGKADNIKNRYHKTKKRIMPLSPALARMS